MQANTNTITNRASTTSTAFSSQRKLVRSSNGDLFAVYLKQDGNLSQVYLSRSIDNGTTWQEVGRISDWKQEAARTTVTIDNRDRIYAFWTKFVEEYGQITYRIFDHGILSEEHQITSGEAYSGYPSTAFDSKGRIHLVWYGFDGTAYQVFYSAFRRKELDFSDQAFRRIPRLGESDHRG